MSDASGGVTKKPGGPPRLDKDEGMMTLRSMAGEAEVKGAGGMSVAKFQAMRDDAQAKLGRLYRYAAHQQAPAEHALDGRRVRMPRRVQTPMQGTGNLSGVGREGVDV